MSYFRNLLALLLITMFFSNSLQFGRSAGPYEIFTERVIDCSPKGKRAFHFELRIYIVEDHGVRKQMFKGNASSTFTKEEFYAVTVHNKYYQRKNNDYLLMYKYDGNMCNTISTITRKPYNDFLEKLGLEKDECAIKPGNYTIIDWNPVVSFSAIPMLEYGSYKFVMEGRLGSEVVACVEMVVDINRKY